MDSTKSNKIRDIVRLQQILKKWQDVGETHQRRGGYRYSGTAAGSGRKEHEVSEAERSQPDAMFPARPYRKGIFAGERSVRSKSDL
ncbi:hypothetical protein SDJN03_01562, partial [Cucurbita argyrosperma subsp. sororia]